MVGSGHSADAIDAASHTLWSHRPGQTSSGEKVLTFHHAPLLAIFGYKMSNAAKA
jgi:hypothetical protein